MKIIKIIQIFSSNLILIVIAVWIEANVKVKIVKN